MIKSHTSGIFFHVILFSGQLLLLAVPSCEHAGYQNDGIIEEDVIPHFYNPESINLNVQGSFVVQRYSASSFPLIWSRKGCPNKDHISVRAFSIVCCAGTCLHSSNSNFILVAGEPRNNVLNCRGHAIVYTKRHLTKHIKLHEGQRRNEGVNDDNGAVKLLRTTNENILILKYKSVTF